MNKNKNESTNPITNLVYVIALVIFCVLGMTVGHAEVPTEYKAQYANDFLWGDFHLAVDISGPQKFKVEGEFFSHYEDNLNMTNAEGAVVREMKDNYNLISQNDHVISGGEVDYIARGRIKVGADSYDVYIGEEKVATVKFNVFDTEGIMYDVNGVKLAQYNSEFGYWDYTVTIFTECSISDEDVLMVFASYASDKRADSSN